VTTPPPEGGWPEPDAPTAVAPGPPAPPGPAGPPPDRRIGSGMLLALGAIALVALGFLITWLLTHRHHNQPPTTVVVTSTPRTNTAGAATIPVPDVRGVQAAHATAVLGSVGLHARRAFVAAQGKPAGSVVAESPRPGARVVKGSDVLLSVARQASQATTTAQTTTAQTTTASAAPAPQPTTSTVPDLSGLNEPAAAQALGRAGLLASLAFVPSTDELGTVEGQGKPAGAKIPSRSHVQMNVAIGPGTKPSESVPNVVGKTLQDALAAINGAHLRLIYLRYPVTSKTQAGKIVQQTPLAGAHAPQNAQVIVYLGAYRAG
jgi:beta-lactam-binding protein with PASTA domain